MVFSNVSHESRRRAYLTKVLFEDYIIKFTYVSYKLQGRVLLILHKLFTEVFSI